ncbi:MAG: hypothetical protein H0U23_00060 [Blastocatellia bacterium]|nr:hypothetical protein [Blastocatellia bacterium]
MMRKIAGTILGLIAAFVTIFLAQMAMTLVATPPTPEMMRDQDAMRNFVANLPAVAYLVLAAGYAVGSFIGGFVATKVAGAADGFLPALVIGVLLTVMGVLNFFFAVPGSPIWAIILCLAMYIPFALIGNRVAGGSPTAEPVVA